MGFKEYKGVNYPEIGQEILDFWQQNNVFEQSVTTREGNPSFTFFEGPPSANGAPGIHHVMARAVKDIICRYKTLKGFQVKRKGGWDTHGLPVELQVEKKLGIKKEDIGVKISVEDYNMCHYFNTSFQHASVFVFIGNFVRNSYSTSWISCSSCRKSVTS